MYRESKSKAVWMRVCTHIHIHLYFPVYICIYICVFRHTCVSVCVCAHAYICLCTACLCVFMCTGTNGPTHFHQVTSDKNMDLPCLAGTGSCARLKIVQFTPSSAFFQLINPWSGSLLHSDSKECKRVSHNFTHGLCIKWCLLFWLFLLLF